MVSNAPNFDAIRDAAFDECNGIGDRLFTKFRETYPAEIVSHSVASAMGLIVHSLLAAAYQMLRKGVSEKLAWEWLEATIGDIKKALDVNEIDFQFTLKKKGESDG